MAGTSVAGTSADTLLGGRVRLTQPDDGYRAAIDPVLLAACIPARAGNRVLDVGAGVGAAALCLTTRRPDIAVVGLELQASLVALAAANIADNAVGDRVTVLAGDLLAPPVGLEPGGFDHVMANPPFMKAGAHTPPPDAGRAVAHGEGAADLADWLRFCAAMVRPRGTVSLIHRADRLDEVIAGMVACRLGGLVLFPLWPKAGVPARRILVAARRGIRSPARLAPGLVLHEADGRFTAAADAILRHGAALDL